MYLYHGAQTCVVADYLPSGASIYPLSTLKGVSVMSLQGKLFSDDTTYGLMVNICASFLWWVVVSLAVVGFYWVRVRRVEKVWVRGHALMLLVYFRNIDWRCTNLKKTLLKWPELSLGRVSDLQLELIKLQADLESFDRLFAMWNNRLAAFPIWHPYASSLRELLESQYELHASLTRHTTPLQELLRRRLARESFSFQHSVNDTAEQLDHYLSYFKGNMDRIWSGGLRHPYPSNELVVSESSELPKQREKNLGRRLESLRSSLFTLLREIGGDELTGVPIWRTDENANALWFSAETGPDEPPSVATTDFHFSL